MPDTLKPNQPALATVNQGRTRLPVTVLRPGATAPGFYTCQDAHGNELNVHRQNLMPVQPVPLRFRRAAFERYAHVIGAALRAFPSALPIDPSPMTPESYAQPLRDAIRGKQQHGYRHPEVDEALFKQHAAELVVAITDNGLVIGPRGAHVRPDVVKGRIMTGDPVMADTLVDPSALDALCLMLTKRQLTPAPSFVVHGITEDDIASFETRYDVAFVPHETQAGTWRLVPPLSLPAFGV